MLRDSMNVAQYLSVRWFSDKSELRKARDYIKKAYPDFLDFEFRFYSTKNMPDDIKTNCITCSDLINYTMKRARIKVYIASPYTIGDVAVNVRRQMDAVDELIEYGLLPFCPLYYHFQHLVHPRPYDDWLLLDIGWMLQCDAVLRLGGDSVGADKEVETAKENGIPVYYSIEDLIANLDR